MESQEAELLAELVQTLTKDVAELKKLVADQPKPTAPPDLRPTLEKLASALNELRNEVGELSERPTPAPAPAVDLSTITSRFDGLERLIRQRPEYKMSQYVQYGAYAFGLMVVLLATSVWLALSWRSERDEYAQAYTQDNWRVRYTKQADPDYYNFMEAKFKEPGLTQWVVEQEEADQKRELARQAVEQAKAMNDQADQLEGKKKQPKR